MKLFYYAVHLNTTTRNPIISVAAATIDAADIKIKNLYPNAVKIEAKGRREIVPFVEKLWRYKNGES